MRRVQGKKYSPEEVAEKVKCIEGVYYIDVTEEGKRLFGETIIESALVRLDLSWVLRKYMPREYMDEHLEEECLVIRFTNGKEIFISNSEWGEVRPEF